MPTKGTRSTQFRLTEEDLIRCDQLARRMGLPSRAAAVRYALRQMEPIVEPPTPKKKTPKKSRKGG